MGGTLPGRKRPRPIDPLMANSPTYVILSASSIFNPCLLAGPEPYSKTLEARLAGPSWTFLEISIKFLDKR